MSLKEIVATRGYLHQCTHTEELFEILEKGEAVFYVGFDCTANSLHVGNLLAIMLSRLLQQYGNKPIILIGGGTSRIGDPSGKTKARELISEDQIKDNTKGILKSLAKFIKFGNQKNDALLVNNADWLDSLKHLEFLRDYGQHFSVNQILTLDFIKSRLKQNQHLSLLEFGYVVLQSFDFLHLNRVHNCILQIGGSDQWGNIVTGVELIHKVKQSKVYGLTIPLLTTANGLKMGKSESGAVWLNEISTSPYEYFQYWRNVNDKDVEKFAALYCEFSSQEYEAFGHLCGTDINRAKEELAFRLTLLCHGKESADLARQSAKAAFESTSDLIGLPTITISSKNLDGGCLLSEILFLGKIVSSKQEAKRLILGGGVKINDKTITEVQKLIFASDLHKDHAFKITIGKKKHFLLSEQKEAL